MSIKLAEAAKFYKEQKHQVDAWNWLQAQVSPEILESFAVKYRTEYQALPSEENTWEGIIEVAKKAGSKWPECVAAQWALESGWGKNISGTHNYFGLKGSGSTVSTQEFINGKWVTINAGFINFPDLETCVYYLVDRWYKDFGKFKGVNRASNRNECAQLLVKEGYATDPGYATKLIKIMDEKFSASTENKIQTKELILTVPYEYQLDNKSNTGYRECFSSTCAMIARYYGKVKSDDEYNKIRSHFGDTTQTDAQINALRSLGLNANFIMTGNTLFLENEIRNQRPIAVGWLHKGTINHPSGTGHWTCCIGFTENAFVFNDPNGEADMINGGYVNNSPEKGKGVRYSRNNWLKRWEVDGPSTGWALLVKP